MKGLTFLCRVGALALLVAASGASAEEGEAMKSILGSIGIIPKEKPPIVYNERAPLVLPPKMELRAPAPAGGPEARNANWPKDPDVAAARKAAQDGKTPYANSELAKLSEGRRLSIEEMRAGRNPDNYVREPQPEAVGRQADKSVMSPDELRAFATNDKELQKVKGAGIERRYLSDPPQGLLKAQGNGTLKASADPVPTVDPDSPYAFFRR